MKISGLIYFILLIASLTTTYSQDRLYINNDTYVKLDDNWFLIEKSSGILFRVDEKSITVKFKQNAGPLDSCLSYLALNGFQLKLKSRFFFNRWADFDVPEGTNIFELYLDLLKIEIIENVIINTSGYFLDTIPLNGKLWNMNPNPAVSYINMYISPYIDNFINSYKFEFINIPAARIVRVIKLNSPFNQINIQDLSPGSYLVRLTLNGKVYQKTLIIQR